MADRSGAALFARIFELLAKNPTEEHRKIASEIWEFSSDYDFRPCQMEAGEACIKLGLAKRGVDPEFPGEEEIITYRGEDGYEGAAK